MPTIGVAVAVPEPWASELQAYRAALGDPMAEAVPSHVTLLPPTPLDPDDATDVERHLLDVAGRMRPFEVHLRGTATFRPVSPVVFVPLVEGTTPCWRLAGLVRGGPLTVDLAFPYHPHVTVAHDLPAARLDQAMSELGDFECRFRVASFHLYEHDDRHGWQPTREFALGASMVGAGA